jgi:hypothetical protein
MALGKTMEKNPGSRIDIVPQGEFHFEVRFFESEKDQRYRSWSLPLAAAEAVTRWWLRRSLPLGEVPVGDEQSMEIEADKSRSGSLKRVEGTKDIAARYQGTPIADWLRYHNLGEGPHVYDSPRLLIVTCMEHSIQLHLPKNFAEVLCLAGANLRHREFDLACALAFTGIRHVCVVGHTDCAMESLKDKKADFTSGLQKIAGWSESRAELQFGLCAPRLGISNAVDFTLFEAAWLERRFPGILVAPLIYDAKDGALYQIARQQ